MAAFGYRRRACRRDPPGRMARTWGALLEPVMAFRGELRSLVGDRNHQRRWGRALYLAWLRWVPRG